MNKAVRKLPLMLGVVGAIAFAAARKGVPTPKPGLAPKCPAARAARCRDMGPRARA